MCGKSSGVISMPVVAHATHRVHMEVMPLFAGYLPLPDVRLFKYLPHHSAHSTQLDAGQSGRGACRGGLGAAPLSVSPLTCAAPGLLRVGLADSWIENDTLAVDKHGDDPLDGGSARSRGGGHTVGNNEHKGLPMPRLQALSPGQLVNASAGTQVLVLPGQDDRVLEVSVT